MIGTIFNLIFMGPLVNLLVLIWRFLESVRVPGALGFSIILLTLLIRFIIWPLMSAQIRSAKKMTELKPRMDELKKKHKDDKTSLQLALKDLYKEQNFNPAAGCLPTLLQFPILIALYQAILAFFGGSEGLKTINDLLYIDTWRMNTPPDPYFFGINLTTKPSEFSALGFGLILVPVLTAFLQFLQSKMTMPKVVKEYPSDSPKEKKEKESMEDIMPQVQSQMMYLMPVMIGYFAFQFPIGLALYWNTFTVLGIIQQHKISGWGGLEPWIKILKKD
ncbi:MAG: YidC/Oxa1 family membrane protein insertase [Candidatus Daviesbacteria bacterium]|nr:YidC/Oxa1 family membrane protein insertase [Candidatus Daviesbacteria bacterium]